MGSLLSNASAVLPPGAVYLPSFISSGEVAVFVSHLDAGEWNTDLKRRVQHFGYRYDYKARSVASDAYLGPLPEWLGHLASRVVGRDLFDRVPDQVIANEYLPGQGISAHVDCVPCFSNAIVSVSLLSQCEMIFREKRSGAKLSVILEPCSAIVLTGPSRYEWTHEIPARNSDTIDGVKVDRARRISLTFRKVVRTI